MKHQDSKYDFATFKAAVAIVVAAERKHTSAATCLDKATHTHQDAAANLVAAYWVLGQCFRDLDAALADKKGKHHTDTPRKKAIELAGGNTRYQTACDIRLVFPSEKDARQAGKTTTIASIRAAATQSRQEKRQATGKGTPGRKPKDCLARNPSSNGFSSPTEHRKEDRNPPREAVTHERYTPAWMAEAARTVMEGIDLDPASSDLANKNVKATKFFTKETDGLKRRWCGRIFMNPPFDNFPAWMTKLDQDIASGDVTEAVVVGPAHILAFRPLLLRGALLLLPHERPKFLDPNSGKLMSPPFGCLTAYLGSNHDRFTKAFSGKGVILQVVTTITGDKQ